MFDITLGLSIACALGCTALFRIARIHRSKWPAILRVGIACLAISTLFLGLSYVIPGPKAKARWPRPAAESAGTEGPMVVRYRPIDSLAEQSTNGLMPGTRFESIMGRRFSTTAELERAFDQLAPNAVVTGKVYGYDLKYDIVVRLKDLQRAGLSQGIASSLALGLRSEGEHLWAFLADAVPFGAHPGTTSILKVAGRNAADLDSWKLAIEESRERRSPVALEIIDANQLNDPHQELDAGTFEGRKRWGILFNPRVPVPARYSGNFFDLPLTIFGVAARFAGLGGTRWRDLIVRFPSYPMRWYEIPSGALTHASFWAHAFGAAFLVAGLLFLLFGGLALKLCIRPVWAIVAVALVTELFLWKELLWIPHV